MFRCSNILKKQYPEAIVIDPALGPEVLKQKNDSLKIANQINRKSDLEKSKKDFTVNAYQIGVIGFKEFELSDFKDLTSYFSLCFLFIISLSVGIFYFLFKENYSIIFRISTINLLLLLSSIAILIVGDGIDDLNQIKYGYYLLALNLLALIVTSRKLTRT
ncbi:hypothetical protein HYN48_13350 [Flavobacterium magnum]|uniref:Uncharacterized protein n=1 Tax=Flavobacterium magnum TaxID=2162713 RepID=A0A2S0RH56_9FLAO|nr:hypothetical protein [Flavobacterium magnum]AWA30986.1 hypothetical protein HYN48_13350 [Flavobacterium magnum]